MILTFSALFFARAASVSSSFSRFAGSQPRIPASGSVVWSAQVHACLLDLLVAVEHRPVVDPHRVGVLVLDDRAVDERAQVLDGLVVELGAGDPLRHRLGQLRRDLVHVGELVGHRRRQLVGDWALGHAGADPVGQGELAAEVVGFLGADPQVGAHRGDSVLVAQPGARQPAVGELVLLIDDAERFPRVVGDRLDAPDLVRVRLVVEQQHDQTVHGVEALVAFGAGELVAFLGGQVAPLALVDGDGPGGLAAVADERDQLARPHQQAGQSFQAVCGDLAPRVGRQLELVEPEPLDAALNAFLGNVGDVEQWWVRQQGRVGCSHS